MRRLSAGFLITCLITCFAAIALNAQQPQGPPGGGFRGDRAGFPPPDSNGGRRGPPRGNGPDGKWWFNPRIIQRLALTKIQQQKIEDIFQQNRLKLIDLTAALDREQAILDPLLAADRPQESRVLAQFDRVAEARLELEKANARMLWGFRTVLSSDQWKELQSQDPAPGVPPDRLPR